MYASAMTIAKVMAVAAYVVREDVEKELKDQSYSCAVCYRLAVEQRGTFCAAHSCLS